MTSSENRRELERSDRRAGLESPVTGNRFLEAQVGSLLGVDRGEVSLLEFCLLVFLHCRGQALILPWITEKYSPSFIKSAISELVGGNLPQYTPDLMGGWSPGGNYSKCLNNV